jgi:hypothetical protein
VHTSETSEHTDLEIRDDVALGCVTLRLGHASHVEVALERRECHRTTDDRCIIANCDAFSLCADEGVFETYWDG